MTNLPKNCPEFTKRTNTRERVLVRFWSEPELYRKFVLEVKNQNLLISDVFNQFIVWFIENSKNGTLLIKNREGKIGSRRVEKEVQEGKGV